jgi:hypothetical protein
MYNSADKEPGMQRIWKFLDDYEKEVS